MSMIAVHLICSRYLERLQRVQTVQTQLDIEHFEVIIIVNLASQA